MPLLALGFASSATAAQPVSEQNAIQEIRAAIDRCDLKVADQKLDEALKRFGASDSEGILTLRITRAEVFSQRGQFDDAFAILQKAVPPRFATSATAVRRFIWLAVVSARLKKPDDAKAYVERAHKLAVAHQPALVASTLVVRVVFGGRTETEAMSDLREATRLAAKYKREADGAKARGALALRYAAAQRYSEAIEIGEPALAKVHSLGLALNELQIAGNLGWAYEEIGDFETAESHFATAFASAKRCDASVEQLRWLNQLGNLLYRRHKFEEASKVAKEVLQLSRKQKHMDLALHLQQVARDAIATHQWDEARTYNAEALQMYRSSSDREGALASAILDARIAAAEGRLNDANKTLEDVIANTTSISRRWEAEFRLAELHLQAKRLDRADAAFQQAVATVREARAEVKLREHRFSFLNMVTDLLDAYVDFLVTSGKTSKALEVTERLRALTLEEGLKITSAAAKLDAQTIAKQNDATILFYSIGRQHSYLWTVTAKATTIATLPPAATIDAAVDRYQQDLKSIRGKLELSGKRGEELFAMLIPPAAASIARNSRVVIIPDGRLHTLNFETLVVPKPQRYWIEDVIVITAPSLQLLARREPATRPSGSMLLVGDVPQVDSAFPRLLKARAELDKIAARFSGSRRLTGVSATPTAYAKASPGSFDFIHFAAHGVATVEKPLDSAIILAREGDDYKLYAREIIEHPLSARLVTISSCHGAGTRAYAGEGLVGLAWAFLRAGAGQVIAALWEVSDSATPDLMDQMYKEIRAGRDPAVALRAAKLSLVHSSDRRRYPRYWAPFVLYSGS